MFFVPTSSVLRAVPRRNILLLVSGKEGRKKRRKEGNREGRRRGGNKGSCIKIFKNFEIFKTILVIIAAVRGKPSKISVA